MTPRSPTVPPAALALLFTTALCSPGLPAQEKPPGEATRTTATPPTTALVLRTTDVVLGTRFLDRFHPGRELPDTTAGQHYELVLTTDGKISTTVIKGDPGYLHAIAHPAALLELFAAAIDKGWGEISGAGTAGLIQLGFAPRHAGRIMAALREFPRQIGKAELRVSRRPQLPSKGLAVSLEITPVADSWLAKLAGQLRPHPKGAPVVTPADPAAVVQASLGIDPEGLTEMLAPLLETLAGVRARTKKEREANVALLNRSLSIFDGSCAVSGNPFGGQGYRGITGIRDPQGYAELLRGGGFETLAKLAQSLNPTVETEFEAEAFKHREVVVSKTVVTTTFDTPARPAGDQISYSALAGGFGLQTTALAREAITGLIDAAQAKGIQRAPLPDGLLGLVVLRFLKLMDVMAPFGNPFEGVKDAPEFLRLELDAKGGSLNGRMRFE